MKMTWEQIDKDWNGLQRQHRMEIATAVSRYCVGHSMKEVAEHLGYSINWVQQQLDFAGVSAALGEASYIPLTGGDGKNVQKEVPKVIKQFGPNVTVEQTQTGVEIGGADADEFQPYLDHYLTEGHTPSAATRLAKAEWAAEAAVEAGVIKESRTKTNKRVNQILFPNDETDTFELDLKQHMTRVEAAARFLNDSKVRYLRRASTCERVAQANAKWEVQAELVLQHYQPSKGV